MSDQKFFSAFSVNSQSLGFPDDDAVQVRHEGCPDGFQDVAFAGKRLNEPSRSLPFQLFADTPKFLDTRRRLAVDIFDLFVVFCRTNCSNRLSAILFFGLRRFRQTIDFFDHRCTYHFCSQIVSHSLEIKIYLEKVRKTQLEKLWIWKFVFCLFVYLFGFSFAADSQCRTVIELNPKDSIF